MEWRIDNPKINAKAIFKVEANIDTWSIDEGPIEIQLFYKAL